MRLLLLRLLLLLPAALAGTQAALSDAQRAWLMDVAFGNRTAGSAWPAATAEQLSAVRDASLAYQAVFEGYNLRHGGAVDVVYAEDGDRDSAVLKYDDVGDSMCWTGSAVAGLAHQYNVTGDAAALGLLTDTLELFRNWSTVSPRPPYMPRYVGPSDDPAYVAYFDGSKLAHNNTETGVTWLGSQSRDQYLGLAFALASTMALVDDADAVTLAQALAEEVFDDLKSHRWFIVPATLDKADLPIRSDPIFIAVWCRLALTANPAKYAADEDVPTLYAQSVAVADVANMRLSGMYASGYFANNLLMMALYGMALLEPQGTAQSEVLMRHLADVGAGSGAAHLMPTFAAYALASGALAGDADGTDVATGLVQGLLIDFPSSKWELKVNSSGLYPHRDSTYSSVAMLPSDRPFDTFMWQRSPAKLAGGADGKGKEYQSIDSWLPYWVAVKVGAMPAPTTATASAGEEAQVQVDVGAPTSPLPKVWHQMVGSGHAALTLRDDWREQMRRASSELGIERVRFHGLFDDDMGVVQAPGVFDWTNVDSTLDFLVNELGASSVFLELGFMPSALASGDTTFLQYEANVTPPRDLGEWQALVSALAKRVLQRYPSAAFQLEVWNEPNLWQPVIGGFWTGSQADYFALYNATATAVREADPAGAALAVGGPATSAGGWLQEFCDFVAAGDVPLDFLSTHAYPTDDGSDNRDALPEAVDAAAAVAAAAGVPLLVTETNTGLFGALAPLIDAFDEPMSAAFIARNAPLMGAAQAVSWWAVSDIFEERLPLDVGHFEFMNRYGLQTVSGVRKPAFRALQLLAGLSEDQLPLSSSPASSSSSSPLDAWAVRRADGSGADVVVTNWNTPTAAPVNVTAALSVAGLPAAAAVDVTVTRIDGDHCNPVRVWRDMGSPRFPSEAQLEALNAASELVEQPVAFTRAAGSGSVEVRVTVPAMGLAVVHVSSSS